MPNRRDLFKRLGVAAAGVALAQTEPVSPPPELKPVLPQTFATFVVMPQTSASVHMMSYPYGSLPPRTFPGYSQVKVIKYV